MRTFPLAAIFTAIILGLMACSAFDPTPTPPPGNVFHDQIQPEYDQYRSAMGSVLCAAGLLSEAISLTAHDAATVIGAVDVFDRRVEQALSKLRAADVPTDCRQVATRLGELMEIDVEIAAEIRKQAESMRDWGLPDMASIQRTLELGTERELIGDELNGLNECTRLELSRTAK